MTSQIEEMPQREGVQVGIGAEEVSMSRGWGMRCFDGEEIVIAKTNAR